MLSRPTIADVVDVVREHVVGERVVSLLPAGHPWQSKNKGVVGLALETALCIPSGPAALDLADGELKTNQVRPGARGNHTESIAVCLVGGKGLEYLISQSVDPYTHFSNSPVGRKLADVVIVQVHKPDRDDPADWVFSRAIHICGSLQHGVWGSPIPGCAAIYEQLSQDYADIARDVSRRISTGAQLATSNGSGELLQIRTKDTKPYRPLLAPDGSQVKDKQMAFYLMGGFVDHVVRTASAALID